MGVVHTSLSSGHSHGLWASVSQYVLWVPSSGDNLDLILLSLSSSAGLCGHPISMPSQGLGLRAGGGAGLHRFSVMKAAKEQEERVPRVSYGIGGYGVRVAHRHWGLNPNPLPTEPSTPA